MLPDLKSDQDFGLHGEEKPSSFRRSLADRLTGLASWDWFINPLTIRDGDNDDKSVRRPRTLMQFGRYSLCEPDPRIERYRPSTRYRSPGRPCPYVPVAWIESWLTDIKVASGRPVGWVLSEEFGRIGGRWRCHLLVSGVSHLDREYWCAEARRRFGYTRIEVYDPGRRPSPAKCTGTQRNHFRGLGAAIV